ncbi:MAG: hypothetical protein SGPRY_009461, partial [Prymnesium sp.]
MGVAHSEPEAGLDSFSAEEQRLLLRNFQLLASLDPSHAATFSQPDFTVFHSAMPPPLAAALF